jgi:glucose/mannose-6-phosphate isomerase
MKKIADSLSTASGAWGEWVPEPVSLAKVLLNKVPVFIGAEYMRTVAYRAKCQTNENAKTVAFCSEIPEAAHNEIEGLGSNALGDFIPVFLRFNNEDVRVTKTQDAMTSLYEESGLDPVSVHAVWDSQIMNMLAMTHYLDVVSVELAGLRGVNALAVEKIAELKKRQV